MLVVKLSRLPMLLQIKTAVSSNFDFQDGKHKIPEFQRYLGITFVTKDPNLRRAQNIHFKSQGVKFGKKAYLRNP